MFCKTFFKLFVSKHPATSSLILFPTSNLFIWIIPKKICYKTSIWNISWFRNAFNLFKTVHILRNTTMHTHYLFINKSHKWHVVEAIVELLPESNFISSFYFVKESVDTSNGLSFVVSSQDDDLLWIPYFECKEKTNNFTTLSSSIDIISHEQIPCIFVYNLILLYIFVFVSHLFKHVQ